MANFSTTVAQNHTSIYPRVGSKDFLQILLYDKTKQKVKNYSSEISPKKILFWAKWTILAQLWPKIRQVYISGSSLSIFSDFAVIGHNEKIKTTFPRNSLLCQRSNCSLIVAQNYVSLYFRYTLRIFFKLCSII